MMTPRFPLEAAGRPGDGARRKILTVQFNSRRAGNRIRGCLLYADGGSRGYCYTYKCIRYLNELQRRHADSFGTSLLTMV